MRRRTSPSFSRLAKSIGSWLSGNKVLTLAVVLALAQLPMSIGYLAGNRESESRAASKGQRAKPADKKPEQMPTPLYPGRTDPFAPVAEAACSGTPEPTPMQATGDLPAMARAVTGTTAEANLPELKPAPVVPLPSPQPQSPHGPKLQGVVNCGKTHIAVFELETNEVVHVRKSERIPGSKLLVQDVLDDGVLVVETSSKKHRRAKTFVGKYVDQM